MKKYMAKFWRGNPQSQNGGYYTTRTVEAKTITQARKKAREYEKCVYGSMTLLDIWLIEDDK